MIFLCFFKLPVKHFQFKQTIAFDFIKKIRISIENANFDREQL